MCIRDSPRGVYERYLEDLIALLELPGNVRRASLDAPFAVDPSLPAFQPINPIEAGGGVDPKTLEGIVADDVKATLAGNWKRGTGLKGFIGTHYLYGTDGTARFEFQIPESGQWDLRLSWLPHENRSTKTTVQVEVDGKLVKTELVDQSKPAKLKHGFHSLGTATLKMGSKVAITILTKGANGNVHADAVLTVAAEG